MLSRVVMTFGVMLYAVCCEWNHVGLREVQAQEASSPSVPPWTTYLQHRTERVASQSQQAMRQVTAASWPEQQQQWRAQLQEMLGLAPWPERTDLAVKVTSQLDREGYRVTNLAFQSRLGLYVTANLYEPTSVKPPKGWPAVLYVCGHANVRDEGRLLGNKTGYSHHGIWLARHNVVCLIIDTIQLGELHGEHHGTYKLGRWDWITRGYTPAGVEAWNAMRAIDYLETLSTVDATQIGITGRSGGGAYSWFAAALDERIKVAVPVAGITDLRNHVIDGCVEGHCDCMYFVNYFGWDYNRLAGLIAPRALLLANSDHDTIFPIDGVERVHRDVADLYQRLGAANKFGLLLTPGPHQDTQELQVGAFRWLLTHLTGQTPVVDRAATKELAATDLQVYQQATPADQRVSTVGTWFVSEANSSADLQSPEQAVKQWDAQWHSDLQRLWAHADDAQLGIESSQNSTVPSYALKEKGRFKSTATSSSTWQLFEQSFLSGQAEAAWRSHVLMVTASDRPEGKPLVHVGPLWNAKLTTESIERELASDGQLGRLISAQPDRLHIVLLPRSQQIAAAGLSIRARIQLERRFYLLGDSTEHLALADMRSQLAWLKSPVDLQSPSLRSATDEIELEGYGRVSALAALLPLMMRGEQAANDMRVTKLTLHDYPRDWRLAPMLPGMARVMSLHDLLLAAQGCLPVVDTSSQSPGSTGEGYNADRQLLVNTASGPQQASGLRIVEPSINSVVIWGRATRWPLQNLGDMPAVEFADDPQVKVRERRRPVLPPDGIAGLRYAAPGVPAELRVRYRTSGKGYWQETPWASVDVATDYSHLFAVSDLAADTAYDVQCQARALGGSEVSTTVTGNFRTLPEKDAPRNLRIAIGTCQEFDDRDGEYGMDLYRTLLHRKTDIFVLAGDVVYYDKLARSVPLANYHWQRMYAMPTLVNFHRSVPTYFLKDDHDTYVNDSWPGQYLPWTREFTFEDGQRIFRQQTGVPELAYRTQRMGRDLQLWFMEGRDYRTANSKADGPEKSIWGKEQWAWLEKSLSESDARFKVIVSPTPIVGPDRENKGDNHANRAFATEGRRVRETLSKIPNLVLVCGDRHWQYHSRDPETGLHEFSVGPVSNRHAGGWDAKDFRPQIHQFLRVGGGYLELELKSRGETPELRLTHFDPYGQEQHTWSPP